MNAYLNAATAETGELTSAVYMVVGLWILTVYRLGHKRPVSTASFILIPYLILLAYGIASNTASPQGIYHVSNVVILVLGLGWIFYNLAGARIQEQRRREQELEEKVQARTQQLQQLVDERGTIIREIHHRVKNNLQLTASLLRLGQSQAEEQNPSEVYRTSISRIQSIALVHERLYVDEQFGLVNLGSYVSELCQHLQQTYDLKIRVDIRFSGVEDVSLDFAVPFGLIMNELVSNAAEHRSHTGANNGRIHVAMSDARDGVRLTVSDSGSHVPEGFDPEKSASMGLQIVRSLVDQLRGSYEVETSEGLTWTLFFPPPPQKLSARKP